MLHVACVLRSGGEYRPEHVQRLRRGVSRWLQRTPYVFVCLTDQPGVGGDSILPLTQGWPGWWSKLELFDGRLSGPVLYLDLDTEIVGPIDTLAVGHRFTALENFYFNGCIGSGLMAWSVDMSSLFRQFRLAPARFMREYQAPRKWGDQGFIQKYAPTEPKFWQDVCPGRVVSFKLECLPQKKIPDGAAVVCFHGRPRPWELDGPTQGWFDKRHADQVLP